MGAALQAGRKVLGGAGPVPAAGAWTSVSPPVEATLLQTGAAGHIIQQSAGAMIAGAPIQQGAGPAPDTLEAAADLTTPPKKVASHLKVRKTRASRQRTGNSRKRQDAMPPRALLPSAAKLKQAEVLLTQQVEQGREGAKEELAKLRALSATLP